MEMYPFVDCPECKHPVPLNTTGYKHQVTGDVVTMAHCPICETVLNIEDDLKITYLTTKEMADIGWTREAPTAGGE